MYYDEDIISRLKLLQHKCSELQKEIDALIRDVNLQNLIHQMKNNQEETSEIEEPSEDEIFDCVYNTWSGFKGKETCEAGFLYCEGEDCKMYHKDVRKEIS